MSFFNSNRAIIATFSLCFMISASDTQAQTVSADIPDTVNGTYSLTYHDASSSSPYKNGDKLTFVINGTNNTLCLNGTLLSNPVLRNSSGKEPLWLNSANSVYFGLSTLDSDGSFDEFNLYSPTFDAGNWIGQFGGTGFTTRVSDSVTCGDSSSSGSTSTQTYTENGLSVSVDVKSAFDLANELYPGLFRTPSVLREYQGYVYRYYRDSGNYIGIKDGKVYVMGVNFSSTTIPTEYGVLNTVLGQLQKVKADRLAAAGSSGSTGSTGGTVTIPTGDFKLTITGSYISSIISINIPNIVVEKMPALDPNDVEAQLKVMRDQGVQNIKNTKLTIINNTATRVTFDLEFQGDITGLGTVTYRLKYDYTK